MRPEPWVADYVRAGWVYVNKDADGYDPAQRRGDCWDFARAVQGATFGRAVPDGDDDYATVADRAVLREAIERYLTSDWCELVPAGAEHTHNPDARPGDLVFLRVQNGWPVHVGVVAGHDCVVHHCGRGVRVEPLSLGFWRGKVEGYCRPCRRV